MLPFNLPLFNETDVAHYLVNKNSSGYIISGVSLEDFFKYTKEFEKRGLIKVEGYGTPLHSFAAYKFNDCGIFINYYENLKEININVESGCNYFNFKDVSLEKTVTPQITQVMLEDFGMSYAIRLSDGRFIIFDGGWDFEPDVNNLLKTLKENSPYEKPVVAAWFLTHPDCDHFHCFVGLLDRFAGEVEIEKVLFNFPEADDQRYTSRFTSVDRRLDDYGSDGEYINRMKAHIEKYKIPTFMPHAGQIYRIGDSVCKILSSIDDTIYGYGDVNSMSLVIRMELGGQVILWTGDSECQSSKILQRYGDHIKADILQIAHHGFPAGDNDAQIDTNKVINPSVCLLPVSDYNAYTAFDNFVKSSRFIFENLGVDEVIAGTPQRTITLPYTAPEYGKKELEKKYLSGLDNNGSRTWIFSGLNTANKEDFVYTILNTGLGTEVLIEMFFENSSDRIGCIKTELPGKTIKTICITDKNDVITDYKFFNWEELDKKGVPENSPFAVRFIANEPIVVSNKNHKATYYSPNR
ncbi:MAG: hypothetical protein E7561_00140 [Ruminococcaceae bacterium]|nr:hypothetical protein [Oscillospiraceae bacterium]